MTITSILVIAGFALAGAIIAYVGLVVLPKAIRRMRTPLSKPEKTEPTLAPETAQRPTPPVEAPINPRKVLSRLDDVHQSVSELAKVQISLLETQTGDADSDLIKGLGTRLETLQSEVSQRLGSLVQVFEKSLNAEPDVTPETIRKALQPTWERALHDLASRIDAIKLQVTDAQPPQDEVILQRIETVVARHAEESSGKSAAVNAAAAERVLLSIGQREDALNKRLSAIEERIAVTRIADQKQMSDALLQSLGHGIDKAFDGINAKFVAAGQGQTSSLKQVETKLSGLGTDFATLESKIANSLAQSPTDSQNSELVVLEQKIDAISAAIDDLKARTKPEADNILPELEIESATTVTPATNTAVVNLVKTDENPDASGQESSQIDRPQSRIARDIEVLRAYPGLAAMLSRGSGLTGTSPTDDAGPEPHSDAFAADALPQESYVTSQDKAPPLSAPLRAYGTLAATAPAEVTADQAKEMGARRESS